MTYRVNKYVVHQLCLHTRAGSVMCPLLLAVDSSSQIALEIRNTCMYNADEDAWILNILFLLNHFLISFCCFTSSPCFLTELYVFCLELEGATYKQEMPQKLSLWEGLRCLCVAWHRQALSLDQGVSMTLYYEWKIINYYIYYKASSSKLHVANKKCQQLPNTALQDNSSGALVKLNPVFSRKFGPFSVQAIPLLNLFLYSEASFFNVIPFLCRRNHT